MTDGSVLWFRFLRKIRPTQLWVELRWVVAIINKHECSSERLGDDWPLYFDLELRTRTLTWKFMGWWLGRGWGSCYLYKSSSRVKIR